MEKAIVPQGLITGKDDLIIYVCPLGFREVLRNKLIYMGKFFMW